VLTANICRKGDLVARYGGEEFVFIIPGMNAQHALKVSEKICKDIEALAIPHKKSIFGHLTVSIGVTSITPQSSQNAYMLIKVADEALYEAKNLGRNTSIFKHLSL
jgi:diguanylate cyclase (GGDEF)-like protein